jgi:hypothetical protein
MNIRRKVFFDEVRQGLFGRTLTQGQVEGMEAILDEWEDRGLTDLRWLAYMLATVKWETARTMQPIEEYGKGEGHAYGIPDPETGETYYGRGYVQLTWKQNYATMSRLLGVDLVKIPSLALNELIATQILFEGMLKAESGVGDFTGVSLERYFNDTTEDWVNARRIINGTDKAQEIANIGHRFHDALLKATEVTTV